MKIKQSKKKKILELSAIISGLLFCGFWLLAMGSSFYFEVIEQKKPLIFNEGFVIVFLALTATLGLVLGRRKVELGGGIMLLSGIALSAFAYNTAGHHKLFAVLTSGFPFIISGGLFIASSEKSLK